MSPAHLTVVGVPADGWPGLVEATRARLLAADVVLGGTRHLALLPPVEGQLRRPWPSPLRDKLPALLDEYADSHVVVLASGDPFVSGIGSTLASLGLAFETVPAVSSVALARARMGWPAESVEVVSVVGRPLERVLAELAPGRRLVVLSSDETTPAALADLLSCAGHRAARMSVLGDLGAAGESRTDGVAGEWDPSIEVPRLNLVAVEVPAQPTVAPGRLGSWTAGLPDDAFEHDGQLTKRDLRAAALARLAPMPGQLLWDVGAGAGSIGIEWMRAHPTCRTIAVEGSPERAARIGRNAARLGVPGLEVVTGRAPDVLVGLPRPDAIFVGGGATAPTLLEACRAAVTDGGRVVVHGVTLETEALLATAHREHGGELTRIHVETAAPIGTFTGWTPARAVTQWAWTKETP
jgi:precorrin-6Y C5,15-methyltransferase (decarboxylating)